MEKVYLVYRGINDKSGTYSDDIVEENVDKVFLSKEKAITWIKSTTWQDPDEFGFVKWPIDDEYSNTDTDYRYYRIEEHDLE